MPDQTSSADTEKSQQRLSDSKIPEGGVPDKQISAQVNINTARPDTQGAQQTTSINNDNSDLRVRIKIPPAYIKGAKSIYNEYIRSTSSILFPVTPLINLQHTADYESQKIVHTNQAFFFYKNTSVDRITITAKWPVQDESDAGNWLAAVHLFRALMKMRFGTDSYSGSPPPVCRLFAYGSYVLDNIPVSVAGFRLDLPDQVDYYRYGRNTSGSTDDSYKVNMVPTISTFNIDLVPMYSREEMLNSSVTGWLSGEQRVAGLL